MVLPSKFVIAGFAVASLLVVALLSSAPSDTSWHASTTFFNPQVLDSSAPPNAKIVNKPTKYDPRQSVRPEDDAFVKHVKETFAFGMLTTKKWHHRVLQSLSSWWNVSQYGDELVTIFTDTDEPIRDKENDDVVVATNVMKTGCSDTYTDGLWCKNGIMMEVFRNRPKYAKAKWFIRVMDDSYVHMENLVHLLSQYDHTQKIVIGEKYCAAEGYDYPTGGTGIIFSRAFVDSFNWTDWLTEQAASRQAGQILVDDIAWGKYLHRNNISITHYTGMQQSAGREGTSVMGTHTPHFLHCYQFRKDTGKKWNLPYRPTLVHQTGWGIPMSLMHELLHSIVYTPVADKLVHIPECKCPGYYHQRCIWNQSLIDPSKCRWGYELLECIAPGPWD